MKDCTIAVSNFCSSCCWVFVHVHVPSCSLSVSLLLEVSHTQHIQEVSTNLSYRIASPLFCAWAASAKSCLIRRRSHTCLYLSTLLNLYIAPCKTTPMVSNTPQYFPMCQFQQFLDANSSTIHLSSSSIYIFISRIPAYVYLNMYTHFPPLPHSSIFISIFICIYVWTIL